MLHSGSWMRKISTRILILSPGLENNNTLKCSSNKGPSNLLLNIMLPGSQSATYILLQLYRTTVIVSIVIIKVQLIHLKKGLTGTSEKETHLFMCFTLNTFKHHKCNLAPICNYFCPFGLKRLRFSQATLFKKIIIIICVQNWNLEE